MRRVCECGKTIHLSRKGRPPKFGMQSPEHHDLCRRCFHRLRSQAIAATQGPKPWWAGAAQHT